MIMFGPVEEEKGNKQQGPARSRLRRTRRSFVRRRIDYATIAVELQENY
jgi:hypothetical protein